MAKMSVRVQAEDDNTINIVCVAHVNQNEVFRIPLTIENAGNLRRALDDAINDVQQQLAAKLPVKTLEVYTGKSHA